MTAYAELGSALRSAREKAGRSVSDVASDTGLPERYVVALEQGEVGELPDLSYARLYLQSYARVLQLDSEKMLESWPTSRPSVPVERPLATTGGMSKALWILVALGVLVTILGVRFLFSDASPVESEPVRETPRATSSVEPGGPRATQGAAEPSAAQVSREAEPEKVVPSLPVALEENRNLLAESRSAAPSGSSDAGTTIPVSPFDREAAPLPPRTLVIEVTSQTWLVIEADGDTVVAKVAKRGDRVSAESRTDFRLTVANPRAIRAQVDGRPLQFATRSDRALVRHLIPRKDSL